MGISGKGQSQNLEHTGRLTNIIIAAFGSIIFELYTLSLLLQYAVCLGKKSSAGPSINLLFKMKLS